MSLDIDSKKYWWHVSTENMMLMRNHGKVWEYGEHDSIERTCHAYMAYGDERFIGGINNCFDRVYDKSNKVNKMYYQGKRYPISRSWSVGLSRDHLIYAIYAFYKSKSFWTTELFMKKLRWKISDFQSMNVNLWLWMQLVMGNKVGWLWYPITYIMMGFYSRWNKMVEKFTGFGEESHQNDYKYIRHTERPRLLNAFKKIYYPNYALKLTAFKLDLLGDNFWTRKIKHKTWSMIPCYNYLLQLMLDSPTQPTKEEIMSYRPMTGDRWADELNRWKSDTDIEIVKDEYLGANELDRDLLIAVYNRKKNEKKH